jgi:hypothetical protein
MLKLFALSLDGRWWVTFSLDGGLWVTSSPLVDDRFVKWVGVAGFLHQRLEVDFCHQTYFPQFPLIAIVHQVLYLKESLAVHLLSEAWETCQHCERWCRM